MIILEKDVPMGPPGMCFICESTPNREYTKVISTMRIFDPGMPHYLTGVKFLCEDCVRTGMVTLGWKTPEETASLNEEVDKLRAEMLDAVKRESTRWELERVIEELSNLDLLNTKTTSKELASAKQELKKLPAKAEEVEGDEECLDSGRKKGSSTRRSSTTLPKKSDI